jgi:hypothetical protein
MMICLFVCLGIAPATASFAYNSLSAYFYEQSTPAGTTQCVGTHCYSTSYYICGGSCIAAAIITAFLIPKTQPGKKIIMKKI